MQCWTIRMVLGWCRRWLGLLSRGRRWRTIGRSRRSRRCNCLCCCRWVADWTHFVYSFHVWESDNEAICFSILSKHINNEFFLCGKDLFKRTLTHTKNTLSMQYTIALTQSRRRTNANERAAMHKRICVVVDVFQWVAPIGAGFTQLFVVVVFLKNMEMISRQPNALQTHSQSNKSTKPCFWVKDSHVEPFLVSPNCDYPLRETRRFLQRRNARHKLQAVRRDYLNQSKRDERQWGKCCETLSEGAPFTWWSDGIVQRGIPLSSRTERGAVVAGTEENANWKRVSNSVIH